MQTFSNIFRLTISGRLSRSAYWIGLLVCLAVSTLVSVIYQRAAYTLVMSETTNTLFLWAISFVNIVLFVFYCCQVIRRLHDIGRNGLWLLVFFIPLIGFIAMVVLGCLKGALGANEYGPNPLAADEPLEEAQTKVQALKDLDQLRQDGAITQQEFEAQKRDLLK